MICFFDWDPGDPEHSAQTNSMPNREPCAHSSKSSTVSSGQCSLSRDAVTTTTGREGRGGTPRPQGRWRRGRWRHDHTTTTGGGGERPPLPDHRVALCTICGRGSMRAGGSRGRRGTLLREGGEHIPTKRKGLFSRGVETNISIDKKKTPPMQYARHQTEGIALFRQASSTAPHDVK